MAQKSLLEDIIERALKKPAAGVVSSIFLAGAGLYLTHKGAPPHAKPIQMIFFPAYHMFGVIFYILSVLVLFFSGIGYIVTSIKRRKQTAFFETRRTLDDIKKLSWKEFEEFIGSIFRNLGYSVEVTGGLDDGGIDLIVTKGRKTSFVQCKKYRTSKVSLSMVRDFYGAMNANLNFAAGYFVTTGVFTLEAKHFADDKPIELIDGAKLMDYVGMTEKPQVKSSGNIKSSQSPMCPKCGAPMVVRVARKGVHANKPFWGCTNYPDCNAIVSYEQ